MFTPGDMERMPRAIERLFNDLEYRVMADIVRRIQINGEVTRAADWQMHRLFELGESKEAIKSAIQDALNLTDKEIDKIYEEAIASGYVRDRKLYEAVGKSFIPYAENKILQRLVESVRRQTMDELKNITQSLGFAKRVNGELRFTELAEFYQDTLDAAILDIASGTFDYNTVLKRTIDAMTTSGLRSVDYASGWSNRVEVAARRAVMTGVTQVTGKINEMNAEELETEYFEVSRHADARPTHQVWQGRVYSKEELRTKCGLGEGDGLAGWNCRHTYYPFIPGVSERTYTDEQLEEMNARENTPKKWEGKEYTSYEASQKQRRMETTIRAQKRKIRLLQEGGASEDVIIAAKCRNRATMDNYVRFSEAMELPQQKTRLYGGKSVEKRKDKVSGNTDAVIENAEERQDRKENRLFKNAVFKTGNQTTEEYIRSKSPLGNFRAVPQEQVVNVMRKVSEPWLELLTGEEKWAIRKYTYNSQENTESKFFERLNAMLRGDLPEDETLRRYANIISGALKKSSLPVDVVCYRSVSVNPVAGVTEGSVKRLRQFVSTSVVESKAFKDEVKIIIYAKKGVRGAYIESLSRYPNQRELLLDKDCLYRVLSNRGNVVELEVLK